jgi:hypothetical protein
MKTQIWIFKCTFPVVGGTVAKEEMGAEYSISDRTTLAAGIARMVDSQGCLTLRSALWCGLRELISRGEGCSVVHSSSQRASGCEWGGGTCI